MIIIIIFSSSFLVVVTVVDDAVVNDSLQLRSATEGKQLLQHCTERASTGLPALSL